MLHAELLSQPKVESESTSLQLLLSHWLQLQLPSLQPVQKESLTFHPLDWGSTLKCLQRSEPGMDWKALVNLGLIRCQ